MKNHTKRESMFKSIEQNILISNKDTLRITEKTNKTWELSPVRSAKVSELYDHPDNIKFFEYWDKTGQESELNWNRFVDRINQGGIHDPLIIFGPKAIADGFNLKTNTIITGHRRKKALKQLGKEDAPVRFIEGRIRKSELDALMLSDNFDRRQLKDPAQKIFLLVNLFPETFQNDNRGGDRNSKTVETLEEVALKQGISVVQLKRYKAVYREALRLANLNKITNPEPEHFKLALKSLNNNRREKGNSKPIKDILGTLTRNLPFISEKLSNSERKKLFTEIKKLMK